MQAETSRSGGQTWVIPDPVISGALGQWPQLSNGDIIMSLRVAVRNYRQYGW